MATTDHCCMLRYRRPLLYTAHWDDSGPSGAEYDPAILRVSSEYGGVSLAVQYCTALRFADIDASWNSAAEGILYHKRWVTSVLLYIREIVGYYENGNAQPRLAIRFCTAGNPFDEGLSAAQLNTMRTASAAAPVTDDIVRKGWHGIISLSDAQPWYHWGVIIEAYLGGTTPVEIQTQIEGIDSAVPASRLIHMSTGIDYTRIGTHSYYEDSDRADLDADILALLQRRSAPGIISAAVELPNQGDPDTGSEDITSLVRSESSLSLIRSAVNVPKVWEVEQDDPGALILRKNSPDDDWEGRVIDLSLSMTRGMKSDTILHKRAFVERVSETNESKELALKGIIRGLSDSPFVKYTREVLSYPDYRTAWTTATFLLDALNAMQISIPSLNPIDIAWLTLRLSGMHGLREFQEADLVSMSVADLLEELLSLFGLAISSYGDKVVIWSPAWFRPSAKEWSIDLDHDTLAGYKIIRSADNVYESVEVGYSTSTDDYTQRMITKVPRKLSLYEKDALTLDFLEDTAPDLSATGQCNSKSGLLMYLAQLAGFDNHTIEASFDKKLYPAVVGDRMIVTSVVEGYENDVFHIIDLAGGLSDNEVVLRAVHWPSWYASHSRWSDTERLIGLWRWAIQEDDEGSQFTGANMLPWGTDWSPLWKSNTAYDPTLKTGSWQGALLGPEITSGNDPELVPDPGPGIWANYDPTDTDIDTYEIQVGIEGDIGGVFAGDGYATITPNGFAWFLHMYKSLTYAWGLVIGIKLVPNQAGTAVSMARSQYFFGIAVNQNPPFVPATSWHMMILAPPGIAPSYWSGPWDDPVRQNVVSLAFRWGVQGDGRQWYGFYVDGTLVGEATPAWAGGTILAYDRIHVRGYHYGSTHFLMPGMLRQWKTSESGVAVPVAELVGENGIDPLYP